MKSIRRYKAGLVISLTLLTFAPLAQAEHTYEQEESDWVEGTPKPGPFVITVPIPIVEENHLTPEKRIDKKVQAPALEIQPDSVRISPIPKEFFLEISPSAMKPAVAPKTVSLPALATPAEKSISEPVAEIKTKAPEKDFFEEFIEAAIKPHPEMVNGKRKSFDRCSAEDPSIAKFPLLIASAKGEDGRVSELLAKGENINQRQTKFGRTALICAIENKKGKTAELLLSKGANPNLANAHGTVPVAFGAVEHSPRIVEKLLAKGADPNVPNGSGLTALFYAQGQSEISDLLIAHGAIQ